MLSGNLGRLQELKSDLVTGGGGKEDRTGREVHLEWPENELVRGLSALRPDQRRGKGLFGRPDVVIDGR